MTLDPRSSTTVGARAVLVAIQLPGVSDAELRSSLDELTRLVETLGLRPIASLTQRRRGTGGETVLGAGKLRELARLTGGSGIVPSGASRRQTGSRPASHDDEPEEEIDSATDLGTELGEGENDEPQEPEDVAGEDAAELEPAVAGKAKGDERATVVVFDHELSPSQLRNLESATGAEVHDRSSVIVAIFQRHARTREARLQVEIARLSYLVPRLRATGGGEDRQRGGVGGKGAGESSLELDRRRVRDRIAELRTELTAIQNEARTRRARRAASDTVALVGYTNAGKSCLMRALTGSSVRVADQLFATLDTTVRALVPETRPRLLVSDTVGFIKKLPHDLVASFRSTLDEARDAALLVHVVDSADPAWRSQLELTRRVLEEMGAGDRPALLVLNKADRLDADARRTLAAELPEALLLSALDAADVSRLHARIVSFFERDMEEEELFVSYREQARVHEIHEACRVLSEAHDEAGTRLRVRAPRALLAQLRVSLEIRPTATT